jgi:hypothetical protein
MRLLLATCVLAVLALQGPAQGKGMGPDFYKVQRTPGKPKASHHVPETTGSVRRPRQVCGKTSRKAC